MLAWTLFIDEFGKIAKVKKARNIEYAFGTGEAADKVIEEMIQDLEFIPAECDGEKVKGWVPLSHRIRLNENQIKRAKIRNSQSVTEVFQSITIERATPEGGIGLHYRSNMNVPFSIELTDPRGQIVYTDEKPFMYKGFYHYAELDNPVNGKYEAKVTQDGQVTQTEMEVNVF